jgi:Na+(H+)/acetate symporter ActP
MNPWAICAITLVGLLTFYIGYQSSRSANTTQDFLVARRVVRSRRNAAAVAGEYLSAASFLGVAGLVLKDGVDALWYPVGFTAGYLALLLFVAAPLRRSGAYTLPDFAEARLGSTRLRTICTVFVVVIGFLYLVPQLQGAGLTLGNVIGTPSWVGAVVVTVVVIAGVLGGGMRAVTLVQAFQYWLKLFAIAAPTFILCAVFFSNYAHTGRSVSELDSPRFTHDTTVTVQTPVTLRVTEPVRVSVHGTLEGFNTDAAFWTSGNYQVQADTTLEFPKGAAVPVVHNAAPSTESWLRLQDGGAADLLTSYSLILALFAGTMGLPHVLVRFYTNPTGSAARRTTLHVLVLLGLFYMFPTMLGVLGRMYTPQLLVTGQTDATVLQLPTAMIGGVGGQILGAVTAAGAFAAFLATSSGLLLSVAGVLSTDLLRGRVRDFRWAAALAGLVPLGLAVVLRPSDLSISVGMSFSLAASTFCPVLVLGVWWRKLTWIGAAAGIVVGGGLVTVALVLNVVSTFTGDWATSLLLQPALVSVPAAFGTTILVSKLTGRYLPLDVNGIMMRLHSPDRLGFIRDRDIDRFGTVDDRVRLGSGKHRKPELE